MNLFEARTDKSRISKPKEVKLSNNERTMLAERQATELKTKKQSLDAKIKKLEKDKKKIEHDQKFSSHIDTNNMSSIPTRKTNLLTSEHYNVEKELYKGGLIQNKPLWVIGDSINKLVNEDIGNFYLKTYFLS